MAEKDTSTLLIFTINLRSGRMAQWLKAAPFSPEEVGMQVQIPAWHFPVFFFFHRFFYLLGFYCLFSLLTLLASRDFFENVFLVLRSYFFTHNPQ